MMSNYNSKLLYNSIIRVSKNLKGCNEEGIFVVSALTLKMCLHYHDPTISYIDFHKMTKCLENIKM
jgi:hypothetical protein